MPRTSRDCYSVSYLHPLTRSIGSRGSQSSTRVDCRRLTYVRRRVLRTKRCPRTESVCETREVAGGPFLTAELDDVTRTSRPIQGAPPQTNQSSGSPSPHGLRRTLH